MAMLTANPLFCLMLIVYRQHTENSRKRQTHIKLKHAIRHSAADKFEMRGITAQNATKRDKSKGAVIFVLMGIPIRTDREWDFKGARDFDYAVGNLGCIEDAAAALLKRTDNVLIPFRPDNHYAGARQVFGWYFTGPRQ